MPTGGRVVLQAASGSALRVFELHAYTGGPLSLPGYDVPVVFDLATMTVPANTTQTPLLKDHDFRKGVGHTSQLSIDQSDGVRATGIASVASQWRDEVVESADNGKEWQLSVGGTAPQDDVRYLDYGETLTVNNRALQGPLFVVSNYLLREISFLETGADQDGAIATLVAAFDSQKPKAENMTFEQWLASLGIKIADLTAGGLAKLRTQFVEENSASEGEATAEDDSDESADDDSTVDDTVDDSAIADSAGTTGANAAVAESLEDTLNNTSAAHVERVEQLQTLNAQFGNPQIVVGKKKTSLLAHAIRSNMSPNDFELEARRRARPQKAPTGKSGGSGNGNRVALLAAMTFAIMGHAGAQVDRDFRGSDSARIYLNAGLTADPNSSTRQQAMEMSRQYRHHTLIELCASAMELDGIDCPYPKRDDRWFQAAFSSNSVQTLFTQSTQAILLDTFMQNMATYASFQSIVKERDVPNFKANERKTVSPDTGELAKLLSTQTASDASLSATGESYSISRFAKRWGIDDQDMINEDFGVFEEMPQFMGMAAARLFGQVVAKLMLTNPNMADGSAWVNTTNGNLRTSKPLSAANMKTALTAFGTQVDGAVSLDLDPNVLFVPKALRFTAAEVFADAALITGNTTTTTSKNVLAGEIDHIYHSALLDNGFNDPDDRDTAIAGENDGWWLFDSRYQAIEVGHLNGSGRGPTIRTGTYTDGKYGVWFDVKRDLGAAPLRRESVQKNEA